MVTGKDGNPLNEVELICDSLMNNDGLRGNNVITLIPDQSVVKMSRKHPVDPVSRLLFNRARAVSESLVHLKEVRSQADDGTKVPR